MANYDKGLSNVLRFQNGGITPIRRNVATTPAALGQYLPPNTSFRTRTTVPFDERWGYENAGIPRGRGGALPAAFRGTGGPPIPEALKGISGDVPPHMAAQRYKLDEGLQEYRKLNPFDKDRGIRYKPTEADPNVDPMKQGLVDQIRQLWGDQTVSDLYSPEDIAAAKEQAKWNFWMNLGTGMMGAGNVWDNLARGAQAGVASLIGSGKDVQEMRAKQAEAEREIQIAQMKALAGAMGSEYDRDTQIDVAKIRSASSETGLKPSDIMRGSELYYKIRDDVLNANEDLKEAYYSQDKEAAQKAQAMVDRHIDQVVSTLPFGPMFAGTGRVNVPGE